MIIDFMFPTRTVDGWNVDVYKALPSGKCFIKTMKFKNKEDAFAYHSHIRQMWLNQRSR